MKKVLLTLITLVGFAAYAQQNTTPGLNQDLKVSQAEAQQIHQLISKKMSANKMKTAGGLINNAFIGWVDTNYTLNGGSSTFSIFQNPIWKDSTVQEEFSNATQHIGSHAIGTTYDPTSVIWGATQFSSVDAYTVDSVYILGAYRSPSSIPNPTGDSLIVEFVWGPATNTTAFNDGAVSYTGASPDDRCEYVSPKYTVGSGPSYKLAGTNRIRTGIALTANDTIGTGSQLYGVNINQLIPAGNLVGYSFYFKSNYTTSTSDIVFSTVSPKTIAAPNFAGRLAQDPNIALTNLIMYFCDPDGENGTSTLRSRELYNFNSPWPSLFPETFNGHFTYMMVSGTSTIGLDEANVSNDVELYPNPTSGIVNIAITQGGTYTIELVNMLGQTVHAEEVSVSGNESINRNFSNLTKGIYLVNVKGDNYSSTTKLTINK